MNNITLLKYGYIGGKHLYKTLTAETEKQIIDPLSCIIRLGLLNFKEKGTKISICNNKIYFQPPNLIQGALRWSAGDSRNDIHRLCKPLEECMEWYDPNTDDHIKTIFEYAIKGLNKLKKSYVTKNGTIHQSNLVCHTISHYVNLLTNRLNNIHNAEENTTGCKTDFLKNLWNAEEIKIINNLLCLANTKKQANEEYSYIINSIESILEDKDASINRILQSVSI